ncbi:hypothetical protein SJAV_19970 [Sulfurisphaera javensis]|uniref:Uncharacterized protein n=1 Tax=Sulfurisphaera javensis TaxID=2049879 RepID=A0AAT9GT49_9CREN
MVTKDDVINVIIKFTAGDTSKEFTRSKVREFLSAKGSKTIDKIFDELEKEGFIKLNRTVGRSKYYVLAKKIEIKEETKREEVTKSKDLEDIKEALREVLAEYFGRPKSFEDLDKVYERVKDDLGYASIKDLREQLGMSLEQFMGKFSDYILQNYELISGGKEGFVIRGALYGIVRKKR